MPTTPTAYPDVATREEWLEARTKLLAREREVTHLRDAVNAERRRLPMVKVEKEYVFDGPDGEVRLVDMFEGRPQLYVHHFMWIDAVNELHDGRRPHVHGEGPRAAERQGRDVRCGVAGAVCEHRALQGRARLDVPVVLVAR